MSLIFVGCSNLPPQSEMKIGPPEFQVDVTFYKAVTPAKKSVIIFPPTGGTNYIDCRYAKSLQKSGFDVYILNRWTDDDEKNIDLAIHQRFYTRAQKAVSEVLHLIKTPEIGLLGTSVGGLHAAVSASMQPRLTSIFVITAGISIPEVIVTSDQKAMTDAKAQRYEKYGFSNEEQYLKALSKEFFLDPKDLEPLYKTKKLGMSIGQKDTTVPTKTQNQLKDLWNPSKVIEFNNNHFWSIVKTWLFNESDIVEFFNSSDANSK